MQASSSSNAVALMLARGALPRLFVAAVVSGTLAACGDDAPQLTATAADRLHGRLSAVRAAARAGDATSALRHLSAFSRLVAREQRAGRLSSSDARALQTAARQARRRIALEVEPQEQPPVTDAPDEPAQRDPTDEREVDGKGKGEAKGKGKGKGEAKGKGKR